MSQKQVELTERFIKDLNKLDKSTQERVIVDLCVLRDGQPIDLRKLKGTDNEWRIRVGVHRIRVQITEKVFKILALRVLNRREAYLDFQHLTNKNQTNVGRNI